MPGLLQGRIAYAGMPNPGTFSLVHKRDVGADYAYNLFYSIDARDIAVAGVQVRVESVTPDVITLQVGRG
ncbi:MAG: hypothetical protein JW753_02865 [Dehalococcoidia bacterium]|nr:hypothetical protein [Dehalococcoidia bacterium]